MNFFVVEIFLSEFELKVTTFITLPFLLKGYMEYSIIAFSDNIAGLLGYCRPLLPFNIFVIGSRTEELEGD